MTPALKLENGGGPSKMDLHERMRAFWETLAGLGLLSLPFWSHLTENIVAGAQVVTAICGAVIGVSGVYRLFFRTHRREMDRFRPR